MSTQSISLSALLLGAQLISASSILFSGGTVIAFDPDTSGLDVIRNGSVLVTDDRIAAVFPGSGSSSVDIPSDTEEVDITDKIITTGFVDTHRHLWQTAMKTLPSNTTLLEYVNNWGEFATAGFFEPDDVYLGQLMGIYESINAGTTTILDHAHHTHSDETAEAGLEASIHSGARVFWNYAIRDVANYTIAQQLANFRDIATRKSWAGTPTSLGIAFDGFGPDPNVTVANAVIVLAKEFNVSSLTTHAVGGVYRAFGNTPEHLDALGHLDLGSTHNIPIVFSHGSDMTPLGASLLRRHGHFASVTPESEMHYGHTHPRSHLFLDHAALGVDTHCTFSADMLTQARLWLQATRRLQYEHVVARWRVPANSPMSANQAFLLATRNGGLALRRPDVGVLAVGAKADLVVWDGSSPSMLGWNDPVAAVVLHASVADVEAVLVDGKWKKRGFRIVDDEYGDIKKRFLASKERVQRRLLARPYVPAGEEFGGIPVGYTFEIDVVAGEGTGYGEKELVI